MEYIIYKNKPRTSYTTKEIIDDIKNHPNKYIHVRQAYGHEYNEKNMCIKTYYLHCYYNIEDLDFILNDNIILTYKGNNIEGMSVIPIKSVVNKKVLKGADQKMTYLVRWVEDSYNTNKSEYESAKERFDELTPELKLIYYTSGGKYHF